MTDKLGNNGRDTAGRFATGNPGRPPGARHKTTVLAEKLMSEDAQHVVKAVIDAAKNGDMAAARIVLDRIAPARKDSVVAIKLPEIRTAKDAATAMAAIVSAVSAGEISPVEADALAKPIDAFVRALEVSEFEARLQALEAKQ
jgi:hypothetical protein